MPSSCWKSSSKAQKELETLLLKWFHKFCRILKVAEIWKQTILLQKLSTPFLSLEEGEELKLFALWPRQCHKLYPRVQVSNWWHTSARGSAIAWPLQTTCCHLAKRLLHLTWSLSWVKRRQMVQSHHSRGIVLWYDLTQQVRPNYFCFGRLCVTFQNHSVHARFTSSFLVFFFWCLHNQIKW